MLTLIKRGEYMKDFCGFRFGNIHTEDLHLVVVSSGDRYEKNLLPDPQDYTMDISGGNGSYYFGSTDTTREFTCNVAFDNVDEKTWRRISNLFATDKLQDLVFDELPYKVYKAKLKNRPEFKTICFTNRDTGQRVYKGEGTLNFICYFPYAICKDKYIVRAADNYLTEVPNLPDYDDKYRNPYEPYKQKIYNTKTKEFYNVAKNMGTPWKGGYPTIEQVRAGELYFNDPEGHKQIIDVRRYFRNVPEWAETSKLLTTPTLDYDQELIYMPQYSKINNINMDIGMSNNNALLGSRFLVYNPGDLPAEFKLDMNRIENIANNTRAQNFQIRRYNVQRLTIPQAVDWTGLKPYNPEDEKDYKYGNRYFKMVDDNSIRYDKINNTYEINYSNLKDKHPNHAYIAEPIPQEYLGDYIRLFYRQSSYSLYYKEILNFEDGLRYADRYEELRDLCIDDDERNELYWKTLKEVILDKYTNNADPRRLVVNKYKYDIINYFNDELFDYYSDIINTQYTVKLSNPVVLPGFAETKYYVSLGAGGTVVSEQFYNDKIEPVDIYYYNEDNKTYYNLYSSATVNPVTDDPTALFLTKRGLPIDREKSLKIEEVYVEYGDKKIVFYKNFMPLFINNQVNVMSTMIVDLNKTTYFNDEYFTHENILEKFLFANGGEKINEYIIHKMQEENSEYSDLKKFFGKEFLNKYKNDILSNRNNLLYPDYKGMDIVIGKNTEIEYQSNSYLTNLFGVQYTENGEVFSNYVTSPNKCAYEYYSGTKPTEKKYQYKDMQNIPVYTEGMAPPSDGVLDKECVKYSQCILKDSDNYYEIINEIINENTYAFDRQLFTEEHFTEDSFFKKYDTTSIINEFLNKYYRINDIAYNYIYMPPEFLQVYDELNYGEDLFSIFHMPQWYTKDYFNIKVNDLDIKNLKLDTDKRMLYNTYRDELKNTRIPYDSAYYHFDEKKNILNDYIDKGHWFKLPPGWSLIDILPVCDENDWGGKQWLHARPFKWGYDMSDPIQRIIREEFDKVFDAVCNDWERQGKDIHFRKEDNYNYLRLTDEFLYEHQRFMNMHDEYEFLKLLQTLWKTKKGQYRTIDKNGNKIKVEIKGTIEEWWWYACNYMWENFPPLYWGYADILNDATIEYTPLYY